MLYESLSGSHYSYHLFVARLMQWSAHSQLRHGLAAQKSGWYLVLRQTSLIQRVQVFG